MRTDRSQNFANYLDERAKELCIDSSTKQETFNLIAKEEAFWFHLNHLLASLDDVV